LEVIPPYKIVVVRTCILKFLHSDPPEHLLSKNIVGHVLVGVNSHGKLPNCDTVVSNCKASQKIIK
jgi:hypothetical protein